jgi:hypothetical protein
MGEAILEKPGNGEFYRSDRTGSRNPEERGGEYAD